MKQTNKEIEIKIPFFMSVIIITICFMLVAKIYASNLNNKVEAVVTTQNTVEVEENAKPEETENEIETDIIDEEEQAEQEEQVVQEEPKAVTYIASNGKQYEAIATLNIPSLGIEYPILSTTTDELLKVSLTKYWGANPNEVGNMVILGHNYKNSKFFGKLLNIEIGAIVKITDLTGGTLDYKVYDTYVIEPDDNACTSQLTDGETEVTLITCYYENGEAHASKRFVVKARAN